MIYFRNYHQKILFIITIMRLTAFIAFKPIKNEIDHFRWFEDDSRGARSGKHFIGFPKWWSVSKVARKRRLVASMSTV